MNEIPFFYQLQKKDSKNRSCILIKSMKNQKLLQKVHVRGSTESIKNTNTTVVYTLLQSSFFLKKNINPQ